MDTLRSDARRRFGTPARLGSMLRPRLIVPAAVLLVMIGMAVFGPLVVPYSPTAPDLFHTYSPPTGGHLLGTDGSGRDVLSRTIVAARLSLLLPVCVVLISSTIGSIIGALSAIAGGWLDALSHRAMTVLVSLPGILLGIVVVARFGAGTIAPVCAVALGTIPHIALLVRSAAKELLSRQFMTAYRVAGFGPTWIMLRRGIRHLLPVIGTQSLMNVGSSLLWLAGLSFLGLGVQPPDADWGVLIHDGRQAALRGQWWQALAPAVCLAAFVLATHAFTAGLARPRTPGRIAEPARTGAPPRPGDTRLVETRPVDEPTSGRLLTLHDYRLDIGGRTLVERGQLTVAPGEIVCLVCPSGSGKSLLLQSLIGALPASASASGATLSGFGAIPGHGGDNAGGDGGSPADARLRNLRRHHIGVVVQESRAGLNPMRRVGAHLTEVVRDDGLPRLEARERATELLADVGLPAKTLDAYPGQLSGGMAARVAVAGALMPRPRLLLADEPTAALDVVTAAAVADVLRTACRRLGTGVLMTTHDEDFAHSLADRVIRIDDGTLVAQNGQLGVAGQTGSADGEPVAAESVASRAVVTEPDASEPIVTLQGIRKVYGDAAALDGVSLVIDRSTGLLGRSGSGKSTLARIVVGLDAPTSGIVDWRRGPQRLRPSDGWPGSGRLRRLERAKSAQLVWQDPDLALDPLTRIGPDLEALARLHASPDDAPRAAGRAHDLLHAVGLPDGTYRALPTELSGGMRQRVVLARALAVRPRLLVLDEPTAQLDRATANGVRDVVRALQVEYGTTLLVISHDVRELAGLTDRVAVLDGGRIVESGDTADVLGAPAHERTRELVEAANRLSRAPSGGERSFFAPASDHSQPLGTDGDDHASIRHPG